MKQKSLDDHIREDRDKAKKGRGGNKALPGRGRGGAM